MIDNDSARGKHVRKKGTSCLWLHELRVWIWLLQRSIYQQIRIERIDKLTSSFQNNPKDIFQGNLCTSNLIVGNKSSSSINLMYFLCFIRHGHIFFSLSPLSSSFHFFFYLHQVLHWYPLYIKDSNCSCSLKGLVVLTLMSIMRGAPWILPTYLGNS